MRLTLDLRSFDVFGLLGRNACLCASAVSLDYPRLQVGTPGGSFIAESGGRGKLSLRRFSRRFKIFRGHEEAKGPGT